MNNNDRVQVLVKPYTRDGGTAVPLNHRLLKRSLEECLRMCDCRDFKVDHNGMQFTLPTAWLMGEIVSVGQEKAK